MVSKSTVYCSQCIQVAHLNKSTPSSPIADVSIELALSKVKKAEGDKGGPESSMDCMGVCVSDCSCECSLSVVMSIVMECSELERSKAQSLTNHSSRRDAGTLQADEASWRAISPRLGGNRMGEEME